MNQSLSCRPNRPTITTACLLLEDLAGVVESIKTNLIVGDLYGPVINTAINTKYIKLDPSKRGPLSYIAGYIVSNSIKDLPEVKK